MASVLILFNPVAGAGGSGAAARSLEQALENAGHRACVIPSQPGPARDWLAAHLEGAEVLVVVGGDGAVRQVGETAGARGLPIYHYPCGTENLFAREWSMAACPQALLAALARGEVRRIDMARANGQSFLLMASVGFDADVVHDLAERRGGAISHLSYLGPILRQFARWRPARLSIELDGRPIVARRAGLAVIANSRQYARRLDPARRADMTDGRLDVVFLPIRSRWALPGWLLAVARGRHLRRAGVVYESGRRVRITAGQPFRYQLDGDRPEGPGEVEELVIEVVAGAGQVLIQEPRH